MSEFVGALVGIFMGEFVGAFMAKIKVTTASNILGLIEGGTIFSWFSFFFFYFQANSTHKKHPTSPSRSKHILTSKTKPLI